MYLETIYAREFFIVRNSLCSFCSSYSEWMQEFNACSGAGPEFELRRNGVTGHTATGKCSSYGTGHTSSRTRYSGASTSSGAGCA